MDLVRLRNDTEQRGAPERDPGGVEMMQRMKEEAQDDARGDVDYIVKK